MTQPQATKADLPRRVGLTHEAIFLLWKMAIKDDEKLLDEAIANMYADIVSFLTRGPYPGFLERRPET